MAPFANRVRGRVPLEKDFAQKRADWYNVMPAYLLLTEREFSVRTVRRVTGQGVFSSRAVAA